MISPLFSTPPNASDAGESLIIQSTRRINSSLPESDQSHDFSLGEYLLRPEPELVENCHHGWVALCEIPASTTLDIPPAEEDIRYYGTDGALNYATFIRSAAKPFQALPLIEFAKDRFSQEELAVTCASHTASQEHIRVIRWLLEKADVIETQLGCGADWPGDAAERKRLRDTKEAGGKIHNNCSGKHAGMLFCCQQHGWPMENYLSPSHPLQRAIVQQLRHWTGLQEIPLATDGCGAPVFYLPLKIMAKLFALLGSHPTFAPFCDAMTSHPVLVGGEGRVDTAIMQASQGKLLAKVGADGVLCVSRVGQNQGLALKIADGTMHIRNITLVHILERLGWLDQTAVSREELKPFRDLRRTNTLNNEIGRHILHFPTACFQA